MFTVESLRALDCHTKSRKSCVRKMYGLRYVCALSWISVGRLPNKTKTRNHGRFSRRATYMGSPVHVRNAVLDDIPEIIRVESETWPAGEAATQEMFRSRVETFPQGVHVAEVGGRLVGVVAFERITYDVNNPIPTWKQATDNGMIRGSHDPRGDTIFGVDLSATPDAPPRTGTRLLVEVGRYAIQNNLKRGILGGRIPGYGQYADKMTPEEYLAAKDDRGQPLDAEVRFYKRAGLKIGKVLPGYFDDPDSLSYGVLLIWENPFYTGSRVLRSIIRPLALLAFAVYLRLKV